MDSEPLGLQYRHLFRFVRRRVRSREQAEDVTQEVFLNLAERLASTNGAPPATLGWLYTVARRRIIDEARRSGPGERVGDLRGELAVDDLAYGEAVARSLDRAFAALSEEQRSVVVLRLLRGLRFSEIASELATSEEACRMRFLRGLRALRAELRKEDAE